MGDLFSIEAGAVSLQLSRRMVLSPKRSPTEIVPDDDDDEDLQSVGDNPGPPDTAMAVDVTGVSTGGTGGSPSRSKRARDQDGKGGGSDASRRVLSPGDDQPVTSREFRAMLQQHLQAMTASWGEFSKRLEGVEQDNARGRNERDSLFSRVAQVERKQGEGDVRIAKIEKDLAALKEMKDGQPQKGENMDPWQAYRAKHGALPPKGAPNPNPTAAGGDPREAPGRDELSEEDKRTLVLGGWAQDTKRQTIQEEAGVFLSREDVKGLLDASELTVYGPRRSFGLLRFQVRSGETPGDVRNRM